MTNTCHVCFDCGCLNVREDFASFFLLPRVFNTCYLSNWATLKKNESYHVNIVRRQNFYKFCSVFFELYVYVENIKTSLKSVLECLNLLFYRISIYFVSYFFYHKVDNCKTRFLLIRNELHLSVKSYFSFIA